VSNQSNIVVDQKHWQEIGDIDQKGHKEQSDMLKRVDELFDQIQESIDTAFEKGIKRIKIVTDHGWLLLPGGLPKEELNKNLTETRWGRCALIKEGAKTDLLHLPWRWNPNIFIAFASGISFFKRNEEYAHGGISLHECLVPSLTIEQPQQSFIAAKITTIKWMGLTCKIATSEAPDGYMMDIRSQFNDEATSLVLTNKVKKITSNKISLMVDSDAESKSAVVVLMDDTGRILDKKPTLVGS
ncbi:MAG: BREX-1 system phosphatase PglZ type B, partial [Ignavibacteriae bacterium]|nr:BREX-1 system phosphatase PglZ type B [Ignavibacteriota bacterium]